MQSATLTPMPPLQQTHVFEDLSVLFDVGDLSRPNISIAMAASEFVEPLDALVVCHALKHVIDMTWGEDDPLTEFEVTLCAEVQRFAAIGFIKKGPKGWYVSRS